MKKLRRRTPKHKVNKRQRALAIKTLEAALIDPATPPHALVSAGRALLNDGRDVEDEAETLENAGPPRYVILPANQRDANVRYGLYEEGQRVIVVPAGFPYEIQPEAFYAGVPKPAGAAARHRARALPAPEVEVVE